MFLKVLQKSEGKIRRYALLIVFYSLFTFACDEPFQPLQENDQYFFSIQGYLDASADTQWVRVTPAREQLDMPPEKPEMHVTLEHLENGQTVVMQDSLFLLRFPTGFNVLNAWTDIPLNPGQTYRLMAERPDGKASSVTVTLPEDFPTPRLIDIGGSVSPCTANLFIDGVDRLIDVYSIWRVRIRWSGEVFERVHFYSYRRDIEQTAIESYFVRIDTRRERRVLADDGLDLLPGGATMESLRREVVIVSGGPEWNEEIPSMSDLTYATSRGISNVKDGVGYLVGIVSKSIPYTQGVDCPPNVATSN